MKPDNETKQIAAVQCSEFLEKGYRLMSRDLGNGLTRMTIQIVRPRVRLTLEEDLETATLIQEELESLRKTVPTGLRERILALL